MRCSNRPSSRNAIGSAEAHQRFAVEGLHHVPCQPDHGVAIPLSFFIAIWDICRMKPRAVSTALSKLRVIGREFEASRCECNRRIPCRPRQVPCPWRCPRWSDIREFPTLRMIRGLFMVYIQMYNYTKRLQVKPSPHRRHISSPPAFHSALMPRSMPSFELLPRLRSKISP